MDKQQASKEIAELLQQASEALDKAVAISEASGVEFDTPWGGEGTMEAGMGATYYPVGHPATDTSTWYGTRQGWNPSAGSC